MGANGEDLRPLRRGTNYYFGLPIWFPAGNRLGHAVFNFGSARSSVESFDLQGNQAIAKDAGPGLLVMGLAILQSGDLFYSTDTWVGAEGSLWRTSIDLQTGRLTGEPQRMIHSPGSGIRGLSSPIAGRRLAFLDVTSQDEVFVGKLKGDGEQMESPKRLTWDERNDVPVDWTPDSRAILITSNRNGALNIFRQSLEERTAELLVGSVSGECDPTVSPDGKWIFYFSLPTGQRHASADPVTLRRAPLSSGPSQVVHSEKGFVHVRCARPPSNLCVVDQRVHHQVIFSAFDSTKGKGPELARADLPGSGVLTPYHWDISRDGSQLALVDRVGGTDRIRVLSLTGGSSREVIVNGWSNLGAVNWSASGNGWFVGNESPNEASLLYVDPHGRSSVLWQEPVAAWGLWAIPSPDGRYLAFPATTISSNVWMIENL
jgi:hypothetical protein